MPAQLVGAIRFPTSYAPWYVFKVSLQVTPGSFTFGDILVSDASGNFALSTTNDAVLTASYCMVLEAYDGSQTTAQVASPGSIFPFLIDGSGNNGTTIPLPFGLVKTTYGQVAANTLAVVTASATDLGNGKVLGRLRNHHVQHEEIRLAVSLDIVLVLTGCM